MTLQEIRPHGVHRTGLGLALVAALTAAGCSSRQTVQSQLIEESPNSPEAEPGGLAYSLPKSVVTVRGEQDANGAVTYTITGAIVPDANARFRLRHVVSGWTDDDLNLQVDRNGLLTSGRSSITDRRAEVVVQLARSAGAIVGSLPGPFSAPIEPPRRRESPYPFTRILQVHELESGTDLPDGSRIALHQPLVAASAPVRRTPPQCGFSICYRIAVHATAEISRPGRPATQFGIVLVNPYHIEGVDLRSAPLVARTDTLTFDSGLLTGRAVTVPSTAVAVASVPYNVLRGFFSAFGELLTIRVNNTNSEAGLITAQTAILNNTRTQIEAERALQATRSQGQQAAPAIVGLGPSP